MDHERSPIDISDMPDVRRIAEEVQATGQPRLLRRNGHDVAVVTPVDAAPASEDPRRNGRRKTTSADDPLWDIVGLFRSDGPTDVSENKHRYLAEAYRPDPE